MKNNIHIGSTIILGVLLCFAVIGYIYIHMQVARLIKQTEQTDKQILRTQQVSKTLDLEWTYLTRPDRIEQLSKVLLAKEQSITAKYMYSIDNIKSADSVQAVSVGDVSYNIYHTGN